MTQTAVTESAFSVLDFPGAERNLIGLARVSTDAQDAQLQQDALAEAGCARIYVENVSTRKAAAERPGLTMMAAFAELERDIIHERTMAGLAAARAQGRNGGRPTVMDADKLAAAKARRARGESPTEIARALGVSRASVYRHLGAESDED